MTGSPAVFGWISPNESITLHIRAFRSAVGPTRQATQKAQAPEHLPEQVVLGWSKTSELVQNACGTTGPS
eukprot:4697524-Alexandrium_andersonii.AAC.1